MQPTSEKAPFFGLFWLLREGSNPSFSVFQKSPEIRVFPYFSGFFDLSKKGQTVHIGPKKSIMDHQNATKMQLF